MYFINIFFSLTDAPQSLVTAPSSVKQNHPASRNFLSCQHYFPFSFNYKYIARNKVKKN